MASAATLVYPDVNGSLAERLERAEARACIAYLETARRLDSASPASWTRIGGAELLFDGVSSPLTQTFGLGTSELASDAGLTQIEAFFEARGAPVAHEVSALTHPSTWDLLSRRGYSPTETSTVLVRPTTTPPHNPSAVTTRVIAAHEVELWVSIFAEGVREESEELGRILEALGRVIAHSGAICFLGELGGEPIAAAVLNIQAEIAVLGGARTVRAARRQGAQTALLAARLSFAAERGAALAMMVAASVGSGSQRNAERQGFRPAYTRSKWELRSAAPCCTNVRPAP